MRKKLGNRHSAVGITLHNISQLLAKQQRFTAARQAEQEAVNIFMAASHYYYSTAKDALDKLNQKMNKQSNGDTIIHLGLTTRHVSDEITNAELDKSRSRVDYSKILLDVGAKDEDMDNALLKTVLEVIQQVKASEERLRISQSDSALVVPPRKHKPTDDSSIKNRSSNPMRNPERSKSSNHVIYNSRDQLKNLNMWQLGEPLFNFPVVSKTKSKQEEEQQDILSKSLCFATKKDKEKDSKSEKKKKPPLKRGISHHDSFFSRMNISHIQLPVAGSHENKNESHHDNASNNNNINNNNNNNITNSTGTRSRSSSLKKQQNNNTQTHVPPNMNNSFNNKQRSNTNPSLEPPPLSSISISSSASFPVFSNDAPILLKDVKEKLTNSSFDMLYGVLDAMRNRPSNPVPSMPQSFQVEIFSTKAELNWVSPNNMGTPVAEFVVEIKKNDKWELIYKGPNKECCVNNLSPNTKYSFRVYAENTEGKSDVVTHDKTTKPPGEIEFVDRKPIIAPMNYITNNDEDDNEEKEKNTKEEEEEEEEGYYSEEEFPEIQSIAALNDVDLPEIYLTHDQYQKAILVLHERLHHRKMLKAIGKE